MNGRWQAIAVVTLLWAALYLPGLGVPELKGEEARRILPARNMRTTGEWVVPQVGGKPYSRKPPLLNWLVAGSFRLTGVENEWSARLPSVVAVLALALGLVVGAGGFAGTGPATAAAVFMMTNLAFLEKGRLAELEPLYVALTGLAFVTWSASWLAGRRGWVAWPATGMLLGLGVLTKGPVHLVFFYAPVVAALHFARRKRELAGLPHLVSLGAMLAVVLPWAVAHQRRVEVLEGSGREAGEVWIAQLVERLDPGKIRIGAWLSTPFEAALNGAPWVVLLVAVCWHARRSRLRPGSSPALDVEDPPRATDRAGAATGRRRAWMRGTVWGTGFAFLAIALAPESLPRYVHPSFPAWCLVLAVLLAEVAAGDGRRDVAFRRRLDAGWRVVNRVLAAVALAAAVVAPLAWWLGPFEVAGPGWATLAGSVVAAAAGIVAWRMSGAARPDGRDDADGGPARSLAGGGAIRIPGGRAVASGVAIAGVLLTVAGVGFPLATARDDVRPVGRRVNAALPEGARVCVLNPGIQPFLFYLDPGYVVVDRPSRIPETTTHLVTSRRMLEKSSEIRVFERFGFQDVLEFDDPDGLPWVLMEAGGGEGESTAP